MSRAVVQRFPMLLTIAREARDLDAYARRADAWSASESKPPSLSDLISVYVRIHGRAVARIAIRHAIERAASARLDAQAKLWASMIGGGE